MVAALTVVFFTVIAAVAFGGWRLSLRLRPYAPCRWCKGRRGRNRFSSRTGGPYGHCGHCGGSGERLRRGAREPE